MSRAENAVERAWRATLESKGGAAAILDPEGKVARSFREIEAEAGELEAELQGVAPESAVALQLGNSPRWPALLLACWRRELIPLPLGAHIEPAELEAILKTCGIAVTVTEKGDGIRWTAHEAYGAREWPTPRPEFLKLTSGTTAAPRGIRFQATQLLADCTQICETMGLGEDDLNYGVLPFSHSYGFSNLVLPLLCRGIALVAASDRLPRAILGGLERTGATVFPGTPFFFEKLAALTPQTPLSRLRLCISAGAPLTGKVAEDFTRAFGLRIHSFYGSSECGGIAYDRSESEDYEEGCVGEPMKGVRIERERPEPRRITVCSPAVGDGYFPEEDSVTLGGGRFVPGDYVEWRERGLYLTGRSTDLINIAGRKLNPAEVEGRIAQFAGVRQVIVFGAPSATRGEEPIACIQGAGIDREALIRYCRQTLSAWQVPRDFWLVSEIPVNERGKTSRRALASAYQARGGAGR